MNKNFLFSIIAVIALLSVGGVLAVQPTQQYAKIFLSPFYLPAVSGGVNNTFSINITTPDGISEVKSAIITFDVWMNPTVTFSAWVDGVACNNPTYIISTTYAGAGRAQAIFDCSNAIKGKGNHTVKMMESKVGGAMTAWLDLTYMNNPVAEMKMGGTEYAGGADAKVWLQLLDANRQTIDNATCFLDIYTPDERQLFERQRMDFEEDGVYYFDFVAPLQNGVYPAVSTCYYSSATTTYAAIADNITTGTIASTPPTALSDIQALDGHFFKVNEALVGSIYRVGMNATYNLSVLPVYPTAVVVDWQGKWNGQTNDNLIFSIYNWTSSSWFPLANVGAPNGGTLYEVTNTVFASNLTEAGLVNAMTGEMDVRIDDTNITDATMSQLQTDLLQVEVIALNNSNWQETRGSSELHISPGVEGSDLLVEDLCRTQRIPEANSGSCAYTGQGYALPEGTLTDNITVTPLSSRPQLSSWSYATPYDQDCTSIEALYQVLTDGSMVDVTANATLSVGPRANCIITLPFTLNGSTDSTTYSFVMDNYLAWEIQWDKDQVDALSNKELPFCYTYAAAANYTYTVPIDNSTVVSNDTVLWFCHRTLDDLYYFDLYYNQSKTTTIQHGLESLLLEEQQYTQNFYRRTSAFNNLLLLNGQYAMANVNLTAISSSVWNSSMPRNLTYYPPQQDLTNYSNISAGVWNYNGTVAPNLLSQWATAVWNYVGRYVHGIIT